MNIDGIGVVSAWGRGADVLFDAVQNGRVPPLNPEDATPAFRIPKDTVKASKMLPREMRRADWFSKIAALAAVDAFNDSKATPVDPERLGIIFASAFGPHNTTFRFLDDIIDFGDAGTSPTIFSHSVHNAAVSYISKEVGAHGPTVTLTQFETPFQQALLTASAWLSTGQCDQVLVGAGDVSGDVLEYVGARKLPVAQDGALRPFYDENPACIPGEGAAFFLLSTGEGGGQHGSIDPFLSVDDIGPIDIQLVDAESSKGFTPLPEADVRCYGPQIGNMLSSTALHCAIGALILSEDSMKSSRVCCTRSTENADHHILIRR